MALPTPGFWWEAFSTMVAVLAAVYAVMKVHFVVTDLSFVSALMRSAFNLDASHLQGFLAGVLDFSPAVAASSGALAGLLAVGTAAAGAGAVALAGL